MKLLLLLAALSSLAYGEYTVCQVLYHCPPGASSTSIKSCQVWVKVDWGRQHVLNLTHAAFIAYTLKWKDLSCLIQG